MTAGSKVGLTDSCSAELSAERWEHQQADMTVVDLVDCSVVSLAESMDTLMAAVKAVLSVAASVVLLVASWVEALACPKVAKMEVATAD